MNDFQIRAFVRQLIAEAKAKKAEKKDDKKVAKKDDKKPAKKDDKKEPKLPKSSGKLMDLKKEVAYLKEMSAQLQATGITEGDEQVTEAEFSNLQKFVNELSKVKMAGAELKKKLDEEITATEAKIKAEKDKIKEMIGLISEEPAEDKKKAKKLNEGETVKTKYGNLNITQDEDGWGYFFNWEKGGVKQGVQNYDFPSKEEAIKDFEKAMAQEKSFR